MTMAVQQSGAIQILRAGQIFTAIGQVPSKISEGDLFALAASYKADSAAMFASPAPFGDTPKVSFIRALVVDNGTLFAIPRPGGGASFAEGMSMGRPVTFASLYMPKSPGNPAPGEVHLHSVGFLDHLPVPGKDSIPKGGAAILQGDIAAFASSPSRKQVSAREAELEQLLFAQKVEKLVDEGRLLPVLKDEVISFCAGIDQRHTVSFASGETIPAKEWLFSFLERMPKVVSFGAMDLGPDPFTNAPAAAANMPKGHEIDRTQNELAARAQQIMRQNPDMPFADAVVIAQNGR